MKKKDKTKTKNIHVQKKNNPQQQSHMYYSVNDYKSSIREDEEIRSAIPIIVGYFVNLTASCWSECYYYEYTLF